MPSTHPASNVGGPIAVSVVSPVYGGRGTVAALVDRIGAVLSGMGCSHEIVLVEDGSPDGSWPEIRRICDSHPHVVGVRLSRNFGQHSAVSAGLQLARGARIVVMDCDLQDRPEEIARLSAEADRGFEVVLARRANRSDPIMKRAGSALFYRILSYLTGVRHDPAIANFGIYDRKVVDVINAMPEQNRYLPTMVRWVGFHTSTIDVRHDYRQAGKSGYDFSKLLRLAANIILANSEKPLRLMVKIGFGISGLGLAFAAYTLVEALRGRYYVLGYASIMVSLWTLAGLIIFLLGLVGLYVGKILEGVKGRPIFVVHEVLNRPGS